MTRVSPFSVRPSIPPAVDMLSPPLSAAPSPSQSMYYCCSPFFFASRWSFGSLKLVGEQNPTPATTTIQDLSGSARSNIRRVMVWRTVMKFEDPDSCTMVKPTRPTGYRMQAISSINTGVPANPKPTRFQDLRPDRQPRDEKEALKRHLFRRSNNRVDPPPKENPTSMPPSFGEQEIRVHNSATIHGGVWGSEPRMV